ncbi:hypothetical protein CEXT_656911 [Caerostris extrusa]|uniref:Uncharacterized protein n=1 Tax=Caerostris extrusa TaxID=172846 RepID=A0AAV4YCS7_CAEEX|nr:hypothetical protein CEXT_656911 [Caerostris extrusa]
MTKAKLTFLDVWKFDNLLNLVTSKSTPVSRSSILISLLLVTPDMKDNSKPLILEDTCSGHLQDVAKFLFHPSRYGGPVSRIFWNFRKAKSKSL